MGKSETIDRNRHIREYLRYYVKLAQAPHYAVLIGGPWGIGKTFLVKKILEEQFKSDPTGYTYVSLYGLTSSRTDRYRATRSPLPRLAARKGGRPRYGQSSEKIWA
jgi:sigma54-dependent transcription regulator